MIVTDEWGNPLKQHVPPVSDGELRLYIQEVIDLVIDYRNRKYIMDYLGLSEYHLVRITKMIRSEGLIPKARCVVCKRSIKRKTLTVRKYCSKPCHHKFMRLQRIKNNLTPRVL